MKSLILSSIIFGLSTYYNNVHAAIGRISSKSDADALTSLLANSCQGYAGCENLVSQLAAVESGNMTRSEMATSIGFSEDEIISAKRLKQLKVLILWLQPEHRFARYCFYGCYCLPDNDHLGNLNLAGFGKPVDSIDDSCKRQSHCYHCAKMDHPTTECDASTTNYEYELQFDTEDPDNHLKKSIKCLDGENAKFGRERGADDGCRRSICECDKKLAEDLRENFSLWNRENHAEQGNFDWTQHCFKPEQTQKRKQSCCGNYGEGIRMPFHDNGRRKCCGATSYDYMFNDCCEGDRVKSIGEC